MKGHFPRGQGAAWINLGLRRAGEKGAQGGQWGLGGMWRTSYRGLVYLVT